LNAKCGRAYSTYTAEELFFQYLDRKQLKLDPIKPNYNMNSTQDAWIVRQAEGGRDIGPMRWVLIPHWEKQFSTKLSTINAKSETAFESRLYKSSVMKRRCVVPVSGFFERKKEGTTKRPFRIFLKESPIMSMAGIWSSWRALPSKEYPTPQERQSFSIMTTAANDFMAKIHDRMPVILEEKQFEEWLDPDVQDPEQLANLLKPCPPKWLDLVEVETLVNSPRNNRAEVLEALKA
jgi:putative SOS response-associated peptidase YedK